MTQKKFPPKKLRRKGEMWQAGQTVGGRDLLVPLDYLLVVVLIVTAPSISTKRTMGYSPL